jgi:hypothetical protein
MAVDRANIEIGTPSELRKALMTLPMHDRPQAQRIAKLAVKIERKRLLDGIKKLVGK